MHQGSRQDSFAGSVAKVDEGATGDIECIMPAIRIFVLPLSLDPLEDLEEGMAFNLPICQVSCFKAALVSFVSTCSLYESKC